MAIVNQRRESTFMEIINRPLRSSSRIYTPPHADAFGLRGQTINRCVEFGKKTPWLSAFLGALGGTRTPTILLTATSRQRVYQFRHERLGIGTKLRRTRSRGSTAPM
jgi:hypothetical protein